MRKIIYSLYTGFAIFLLNACENGDELKQPVCDTSIANNIQHSGPISGMSFSTKTGSGWHLSADGYCEYPLPTDSSLYVDLDLNADTINDFRISMEHYNANTVPNPSQFCNNFVQKISIKGLSTDNEISYRKVSVANSPGYYSSYSYTCAKSYNEGETIEAFGSFWTNEINISLVRHFMAGSSYGNPSLQYLGVKVNKNGEDYYGWIKLTAPLDYTLTIHEYALNNTAGNCINAGE